ncbi:dTDP-4-dehydrorhamnose 3,5-epimerase [Caulobacter sp. 73W]|uniref:dTDP-4-dehydrorhamnose 3,5-epimerase n=1 Tax=Caulobacter sp. 73W TaxID=3161137 RepID=A0AB39KWS7_9CAUL
MRLEETEVEGVRFVRPFSTSDARGGFVKAIHAPTFAEHGLATEFPEVFWSSSRAGVIRGMHLQAPPHDHDKLVLCTAGRVLDVAVDLRAGSPTFRKIAARELDGAAGTGLYIPRGCAHGFLALTEGATLLYAVTSVHSPDHDTGVRFDSIGFDWPGGDFIVSDRDRALPEMDGWETPFS